VKSLGASAVIDYTREDLTQRDETYDVVFDAVGKLAPTLAKKMLKPRGVYLNVLADSGNGEHLADLVRVKELIEAGKLKPVIDRVYPFDQIIAAHCYVERGHKRGNVVLRLAIGTKHS
jgi:NADPH:quinone reductase-like Zn-dependent oxidoreductase